MDELMKEVYQALGFEPREQGIALWPIKSVPYPEHCRHKDKCAGLSSCPRDPVCID